MANMIGGVTVADIAVSLQFPLNNRPPKVFVNSTKLLIQQIISPVRCLKINLAKGNHLS